MFAVLFVSMAVLTWPDVPWTTVLIVTMAVNLVFPVLFYPWARMLWVALDMAFRPADDSPLAGAHPGSQGVEADRPDLQQPGVEVLQIEVRPEPLLPPRPGGPGWPAGRPCRQIA